MTLVNRQLRLRERPTGVVDADCFSFVECSAPKPGRGEVLVRVVWLGIDPTQRTWLNPTATYASPVAIGEVMRGAGAGQIIESRAEGFSVGEWVVGPFGWQDYCVCRVDSPLALTKAPAGVDPKAMLGVLGANGLTAYFGLTEITQPTPGETAFVSAAAGCTGAAAAQIAKRLGCRVIGSAGSAEKCAWAINEAGLDDCVDYNAESLTDRLRAFAPEGIHVVFDNVGGPVLEAALDNLALRARIALCGAISSGYRERSYGVAPVNYMQLAFKRARMEGFIFLDYFTKFSQAFADLSRWLAEGSLQYREQIADGLGLAPAALQGLFEGQNLGKQLVKV